MDIVEVKGRNQTLVSRHPWEQARLFVANSIIKRHVPLSKGDVVIDVGCGDTYVIENLSKQYPDVLFYAVDTAFDDNLIINFSKRLNNSNIKLFKSMEDIHDLSGKSASLILLMDVIEHIEDDVKFFKYLNTFSFIDLSTYFFITVPAFQNFFCTHDVFLGHYRRYTNKLLKKNTSLANLKTQSSGYFFTSLLLPRLIQVTKENVFKIKPSKNSTGLTEWSGGKFVASFFKNILIADFYFSRIFKLIGINIVGLSNYAICKKSV